MKTKACLSTRRQGPTFPYKPIDSSANFNTTKKIADPKKTYQIC